MKLHLIYLVTVLGAVTAQFECPSDGQGGCVDGLYPVPGDCTVYYECLTCVSYTRFCPQGSHFDRYEEQCQDPIDARCDWSYITGSLFCVASEYGSWEGPLTIDYHSIIVNNQNPFDPPSDTVLTGEAGTYFFHLAAGTRPGETVDIRLSGLPYDAGVFSNNPLHNIDVQSRNIMASLSRGVELKASLLQDTWISSDASRSNMWVGFRLEDFMNNVVAFSASRAQAVSSAGVIVFDNEYLDTFNSYDDSTGEFTAPIAGTYLFSFSALVATDERLEAYFDSDINGYTSVIFRTLRANTNVMDTISKTIMVNLAVGEKFRINVESGSAQGSFENSLAFSGFLYQPLPGTTPQAWSLYRTNGSETVDPLTFDVAEINEGLLYNTGTGRIQVDISGYYFITLVVGTATNSPVDANLIRKRTGETDTLIFSLYRSDDTGFLFDGDTLCKSAAVELLAGDEVRVAINSGGAIFSTEAKLTSFSGFLLQALV